MRSDRKSTAKGSSRCRSCGPRTAAGKAIASRNALKHGLSAIVYRPAAPSAEIERFAKSLCGQSESAALLGQARAIALNALTLRAINAQKVAVIERLREPTAIALAKGDNSSALAKAIFMGAWLAHREIEALVPKVLEKYKDQIEPSPEGNGATIAGEFVPISITALLEETDSIQQKRAALELALKLIEEQQRDEHAALAEAAADLVRLDRYERRAWSRQKRAIRSFMIVGGEMTTD